MKIEKELIQNYTPETLDWEVFDTLRYEHHVCYQNVIYQHATNLEEYLAQLPPITRTYFSNMAIYITSNTIISLSPRFE